MFFEVLKQHPVSEQTFQCNRPYELSCFIVSVARSDPPWGAERWLITQPIDMRRFSRCSFVYTSQDLVTQRMLVIHYNYCHNVITGPSCSHRSSRHFHSFFVSLSFKIQMTLFYVIQPPRNEKSFGDGINSQLEKYKYNEAGRRAVCMVEAGVEWGGQSPAAHQTRGQVASDSTGKTPGRVYATTYIKNTLPHHKHNNKTNTWQKKSESDGILAVDVSSWKVLRNITATA